jgi:phosphate transport system permease protein
VPSIVFGILGLAVFINFMGLPQSSSIVGALVLSLMTLPTIIIATRASLRAVPPSIRDAALGVGASKMQTVFHHVLPLAMPGILTGTILGLASALGETAPLLLIGMVAFVGTYPAAPAAGFLEPATALPVQVYSWASRADPAFVERSAGAIIVLLFFLLVMNALAIVLRRRFEKRW